MTVQKSYNTVCKALQKTQNGAFLFSNSLEGKNPFPLAMISKLRGQKQGHRKEYCVQVSSFSSKKWIGIEHYICTLQLGRSRSRGGFVNMKNLHCLKSVIMSTNLTLKNRKFTYIAKCGPVMAYVNSTFNIEVISAAGSLLFN